MRERRVVSILFSDLSGFTRLSERMDPEDVADTVDALFKRFRSSIESLGGTVDKFIGDAVMAVFGAPVAHADDAARAVRAGLALHLELDAFNRERGLALAMRVGVNSGEVLWGSVGGSTPTAMGDTVNVAQRLENAARPGTVLVAEATRNAAGPAFVFAARGAVELKGRDDRVPAFEVTEELSGQTERGGLRAAAAFVGRDPELKRLEDLIGGGRPGFIVLEGEAGVGKSRLLAELRSRLRRSNRGIWIGVGRAYERGQTAYGPLADIIVGTTRVREEASRVADAVAAALEPSGANPQERAADARLIAISLGSSLPGTRPAPGEPARQEEETLQAWTRWLGSLGARRPALLCIEDLHWADEATRRLLEFAARRLGTGGLVVVATSRPSVPAPAGFETVRLRDLGPGETRSIAEGVFGSPIRDDLARFIVEKSGGHPYYAEELSAFLQERGHAGGNPAALVSPPERLPDGLLGLLVARLDALPEPVREALKTASVFGRAFWPGVVAEISAVEPGTALEEAVRRDAAMSQATSLVPGERQLSFRHALLRDAAYSLVPRKERQELHRRAGVALEKRAGGRRIAAMAAEQHLQSGNADRAHELWCGAAEEAGGAHSQAEALGYGRSALQARRSCRALTLVMNALVVQAAYGEALALAKEIEGSAAATPSEKSQARFQRAWTALMRGQFDEALDLARSIVAAATGADMRARALMLQAAVTQSLNRPAEIRALLPELEQAISDAEAGPGREEAVRLRANFTNLQGVCAWQDGRLEDALSHYARATEICRDDGNRVGMASALHNSGMIYQSRAEYRTALDFYGEAVRLRREEGSRQATASTLSQMARTHAVLGEWDEAVALFEQSRHFAAETGDILAHVNDTLHEADLEARRGRRGRATQLLEEADRAAATASLRDVRGNLATGWGVVLQSLGRPADALEHFQRAHALRSASGHERNTAIALRLMAGAQMSRRAWEESDRLFLRAEAEARRLGDREGLAVCVAGRADGLRARGDFAAAIALHGEALSLARDTGSPVQFAESLRLLGLARADAGEMVQAHDALVQGESEARKAGHARLLAECLVARGRVALDLGRAAEARAALKEVLSRTRGGRSVQVRHESLLLAAGIAAFEGRDSACLRHLRRAVAEAPREAPVAYARARSMLARFLAASDARGGAEALAGCEQVAREGREPLGELLTLSARALLSPPPGLDAFLEQLTSLLPGSRVPFRDRMCVLADQVHLRWQCGDLEGARGAAASALSEAQHAGAAFQARHFDRLLADLQRSSET